MGRGGRDNEPLILRTIDGGSTWKESNIRGELTPEIRQIRFADALHGWAVGPRAILYTSDGGSSWNPQFNGANGVWLNELAVLGPEQAWAIGGRGVLLRTKDHGVTWSPALRPGMENDFLWAIAFADPKNGWISGAKGAIFATHDGGDAWERQVSPVKGMLVGIAVTHSRVFIIGDSSRLLMLQR